MARIVIVAGTDAGQDVAAALSAAGHEVLRAESLSTDQRPDVLFVEPSRFAAGESAGDVPVVILAPNESVASALQAVDAGAFDLLRLPASSDEIRLAAERAVRFHQLVEENEQLRHRLAVSGADVPAGTNTISVAALAKNLAGKPLADIEKQVILSALEQFKGHRIRTAAALGIGVRTLGMKIKRWREEGEPIAGRHQPRTPIHMDVS